ncbi:type IV toxin-antitoxin system AbiEi family antitoxin domain-containing protein, partial [Thiolapillus sp.]
MGNHCRILSTKNLCDFTGTRSQVGGHKRKKMRLGFLQTSDNGKIQRQSGRITSNMSFRNQQGRTMVKKSEKQTAGKKRRRTTSQRAVAKKTAAKRAPKKRSAANTLDHLSAADLRKLAEAREREEAAKRREEAAIKLAELKAKRRAVEAEYRKTLRAIDREIEALKGKQGGSGRKQWSVSEVVTTMLAKTDTMTTTDIRNGLNQQKIKASNLSQTLTYLKRRGRIEQVKRGVYRLAGQS